MNQKKGDGDGEDGVRVVLEWYYYKKGGRRERARGSGYVLAQFYKLFLINGTGTIHIETFETKSVEVKVEVKVEVEVKREVEMEKGVEVEVKVKREVEMEGCGHDVTK